MSTREHVCLFEPTALYSRHRFDPSIFLSVPLCFSLSSSPCLSVPLCDLSSSEEWARCRLSSARSSALVRAESNRLDEL